MEFHYTKNKIVFNRELSNLDELVLRFCDILHRLNIRYVIISGYIAILFGRARNTIDVDLFIEKIDEKRMKEWWGELEKNGFECIIPNTPEDALEYLGDATAIRFCEKNKQEPNFEIKFPRESSALYTLENRIEVQLNGRKLYTSELEMQIAYKLMMASDKDLEDALHVYRIFKEQLDKNLIVQHLRELDAPAERTRILW
jgi:predicted nucleotidyltransferase